VPAAYYWSPTLGTSSAVPDNWLMGPGVPYAQHTEAPNGDDDLIFRGDVTQAHCTITPPSDTTSPGQPHFRAVEMIFSPEYGSLPGFPAPPRDAYLGTVTLADSLKVGELTVECGNLKQADLDTVNDPVAPDAGTLTVMLALDWTGGTLNSNDVHGTTELAPGTVSVAAPSYTNPGINQTVGLGSTIKLLSDQVTQWVSTLEVLSGQYDISNNAGFVVGSQCSLQVKPVPGDTPAPGGGNQPQYKASVEFLGKGTRTAAGSVTAMAGSTVTFEPKLRPAESTVFAVYDAPEGPLKNEGGTVIISDRIQAKFGGFDTTDITLATNLKLTAAVYQTAGTLSLQAGSQIITAYGVAVSAGNFVSPALNPDGSNNQEQPKAVIQATDPSPSTWALFLDNQASLDLPGNPYRTPNIIGNFAWYGKVRLAINAWDNTKHDLIEVTGYVRVLGNAPKLELGWHQTAETEMRKRAKGTEWIVVTSSKATDGILGEEKLNQPGNLLHPDKPQVTMEVQHSTDKKEMFVRKTSDPIG
jgi:hypothetical protein